ncbi:hypothetical protein Bca52824_022318 [Brassica carinata]|uniref:DUF676 domain-containing protein n=1 Tax=Brassica carinata TaxID=52824 RepID=A0A8X7VGG6_BRACI|nr:hypothetical protein Bca52824_022318 [Brassica carinata]
MFVHRSESNSSTLTFDGVDMMGERLANEVFSIVKNRGGGLKKISFVAHLLRGLVARYAVGKLSGTLDLPLLRPRLVDSGRDFDLTRPLNGLELRSSLPGFRSHRNLHFHQIIPTQAKCKAPVSTHTNMKSVNGELTETEEEDGGEARVGGGNQRL